MTRHLPAALTLAALACLTACGSTSNTTPTAASTTACKAAMLADYQTAINNPNAPSATEPAACHGLDTATLQRLAGEVMQQTLASPSPTSG